MAIQPDSSEHLSPLVPETEERELPVVKTWQIIANFLLLMNGMGAAIAGTAFALKKRRITPQAHIGDLLYDPSFTPSEPDAIQSELNTSPPRKLPVPSCADKKEQITEIFTTLAKGIPKNPLTAAFTITKILGLGAEIAKVHPLSLMVNMPKDAMRKILQTGDSYVCTKIIGDIKKAMLQKMQEREVSPYLADFAVQMNKEESRLRQLIQADDWKGFVQYAFDTPL